MQIETVYIGGPIFNRKEQEDLEHLAKFVEDAGFKVLLPHREYFMYPDIKAGFIAKGLDADHARKLTDQMLFYLCLHSATYKSQAMILNLNGRVPDEGGIVEGTAAFMSDHHLILYKDDVRSPFEGHDNCMLTGLTQQRIMHTGPEVVEELHRLNGQPPKSIVLKYVAQEIANEFSSSNKTFEDLLRIGFQYRNSFLDG